MPLPEWGGAFEKYARGFVSRNFWRVQALYGSEEDAVQECALLFIRIIKKYADTAHNPKHFMALYKTTLQREFHSRALLDPRHRAEELPGDYAEKQQSSSIENLLVDASNEGKT